MASTAVATVESTARQEPPFSSLLSHSARKELLMRWRRYTQGLLAADTDFHSL